MASDTPCFSLPNMSAVGWEKSMSSRATDAREAVVADAGTSVGGSAISFTRASSPSSQVLS